MTEALRQAADIMEGGYWDIDAPFKGTKGFISEAEEDEFTVTDSLSVTKDGKLTPSEEQRRAELEHIIDYKARAVETADKDVQEALARIRSSLNVQFEAIAKSAVVPGEHYFEKLTGRRPLTAVDIETARALDPRSNDPKYKGVPAEVKVVRIRPVPGKGLVRMSQFIKEPDVWNPISDGVGSNRNLGDNRDPDRNFRPDDTRVAMYVDYENGVVLIRQNPSVAQRPDGSPGLVSTGNPTAKVLQARDGSVRISLEISSLNSANVRIS